jgi:hypothetical protein
MIEKEEENTYMHRAVKKCGSHVLLNFSGKFGISPEF